MSKVYLVRHGECTDNKQHILNGHRESFLTALGRKQIKETGQKLADNKITAIFSSPLARTLESAKIIASLNDIEVVQIVPSLIERDFGFLTGHPTLDIKRLAKKVEIINGIEYFFSGEGVESFPKVYKRAQSFWKKLVTYNIKGNVVVVTHGDIGMMLKASAEGWDWQTGLHKAFWKNGEILEVKLKTKK